MLIHTQNCGAYRSNQNLCVNIHNLNNLNQYNF